jgi:hypothetical protein
MPSGLAYRVYRLRVPSSAKRSTGTNRSPERTLPNVTVGEVRILHARHHERESRIPPSPNNRAQTPPKLRMHPSPGPPRHPEGSRNESTSWKLFAGKRSCRMARSLASLNELPLRPAEPNGDPDANIEIAPSPGIDGLVIDASSRRCCHRCRLTPQIPLLHQTRQNQTLELGRRLLPLSILSVGYAAVIGGCPPLTSARQQKQ